MEDSAIISILEELKTSSRSRIVNNLIKIRQQVIITDDGIKKFKTNGGISLLISLLHKPNEKISDLALSILGNCCMKRDIVLEVEKLNGLRYVLHIIKNIAKDSILCRACRVVGNVAQFDTTVDNVHEFGAVGAICDILNSADNHKIVKPPTKLMAIRALRLLWTTPRRQHEMLAQNVPKSVVMVLIEHKSKCLTSSQDKDLVMGALRCLLHFTGNPSPELVLQMVADGTGFQSIVSLIPLSPYYTIKCITNLSTVATTRSVLETNEAARILIERLSICMVNDPCSTWPVDDLNALCMLCRHAATREEVRSKNGLPLLLNVVKHSSNKQQQGQVLHALLHFIYDEASLQILISDGLVTVLVTCLTQFLNIMKCQHDTERKHALNVSYKQEVDRYACRRLLKKKNHGYAESQSASVSSLKRCRDDSDESDLLDLKKQQRFEDSCSPISFDTRLSPQPSTCYSPSCTPPRSIADIDEDSNSDDSIRYSPVCSDSESDDDKPNWEYNIANFENEDFVHYEMGDNELENALEEEMEPKTGEVRTIGWLLVLLSRASYMDDLDPAFGNVDTFQVLLRYMQLSSQPITRAARILLRIVSRWDFLISLLNNKLVLILHDLLQKPTHGDTCNQCIDIKKFLQIVCNKLTCVAESGYGKGQIAHALLRGEHDKQEKLIISIPYLIQSKSLLRSLFFHCRGLELLLSAVSNTEVEDWNCAVNALGLLAIRLKIKDPKQNDNFGSIHDIDCEYIIDLSKRTLITFELDDRSTVDADKDLLIEKSDFFKILLTGTFKESKESVVRLSNVSNNGFKYLLTLLEHYHNTKSDDNVSFPLCLTLSVVLEVLVLADRFLLDYLTDTLSRAILKYRMRPETVAEVYKSSLVSHTGILRVESVAYGLVGLTEQSRVTVFKDVINDGYSDYLIEDCRVLLNRYLNII